MNRTCYAVYVLLCIFSIIPLTAKGYNVEENARILKEISELDIPVLEIITVNGEEPTFKTVNHPGDNNGKSITDMTRVPGRLTITKKGQLLYDSGDYVEDQSGMKFRVRGNASPWDMYPRPYKIKLEKKADLLLRGDEKKYKDKNWVLLREIKLRCMIGFKVNELVNLQWTPAYEYVNFVMNGEYIGLYMLCESVRRNTDCRLDVDETGYVFEYDQYWWNEDLSVESNIADEPLNYTFKYPKPEEITNEQLSYFKNMIGKFEQSVKDGTYPQYMDLESFAEWILGHDILGSWDGTGSNFFLTKYDNTDSSKVMMGNMWDLDNSFYMTDDWDNAHYHFVFKSLLDPNNDSKDLLNAYINKWDELSPTIFEDINTFLEDFNESDYATDLTKAFAIHQEYYDEQVRSVEQYIIEAQYWFKGREPWMTKAMNQLRTEVSGIHSISSGSGEKQIFSLDGRRLQQLERGINIVRYSDGTSKKVFVK